MKYKKESKNVFGMFLECYRNIFKDNIKIPVHLSWHFTIRKYFFARFGLLDLNTMEINVFHWIPKNLFYFDKNIGTNILGAQRIWYTTNIKWFTQIFLLTHFKKQEKNWVGFTGMLHGYFARLLLHWTTDCFK